MYNRVFTNKIKQWTSQYPVVAILGPRQSGKSTLCRMNFPDYTYLNLEDPQTRALVKADPKGEVFNRGPKIVIDEVQRWPEILSYLQVWVDEPGSKLSCIITGSNHLLLMQKITQTLAGRIMLAKLMPLSWEELRQTPELRFTLDEFLFTGGYPRIYDQKLNAREWLGQYISTYVERDVRDLLHIGDLDAFQKFIGLCAGRVGNLVNLSSLGNDAGVTHPTARTWLSALKTGFICFTLAPHHRNFSKRLIKTPKLYFYDTGILCHLLNILDADMLSRHPLRGAIFENAVIVEKLKHFYNRGEDPKFYFWRDVQNHEVDLIEDRGDRLYPVEIKSSRTFLPEQTNGLEYFDALQAATLKSAENDRGSLIMAGDEEKTFRGFRILPWTEV